ncbi:MAG: extracellular solute-binding protein [Treponema sp.]|jgi:putative aldouronate transport system substrate-binding protein|nr:extracellular solute-binding protein [Treponema sp.]
MRKRFLGIVVVGLMALTTLENVYAGGGGQKPDSGNKTIDQSNFTPLGTYPIVKTKETITIMSSIEFAEQNYDTNWMTEFYENKTNVHVNWVTAPLQEFKTRLNTVLASGEYLDYISCGGHTSRSLTMNEIMRLAEQELILPMQDYIESDSVYFKNDLTKIPGWKQVITLPNGNMYAIPSYSGDYHTMYYGKMWVNKLFLKNVGLDYPKTIDEFYNMLVAFKTKDANGNGNPNDEIPLIGATDTWSARLSPFLMSAFIFDDGENRLFLENGKIVASYTRPEWQEGLRVLNQWFKEGLISRDSFTMKRPDRHQLNSSKYESIIGAMPNPHNLNLGVREAGEPVRWIDYEPIAPIKGPKGVQETYYGYYNPFGANGARGVVPATCKNPALVMRWLDWFGSQEGTLRVWFGMSLSDPDPSAIGINGKLALFKGYGEGAPELNLKPGDKYYNNFRWGEQFPLFRDFDLYEGWQKAVDMLAPDGSGQERFLTVKSRENYAPYGQKIESIIPPMFYSQADIAEMTLMTTNINTYVEESFAKFVVGDLNINTQWAVFQNELKKLGIDRYLEIIQKTYNNSSFANGSLNWMPNTIK